jgi:hypothetical protein
MRKKPVVEEQEDTTAQAGWMYADLFLALMVVFLATISFVPTFNGNSNLVNKNQGSTLYTYSDIYAKHLDILYTTYDPILIQDDIKTFVVTEGLPSTTEVIFVQVIGGYSPQNENASIAIKRALAFTQKIDKDLPDLLHHAASTMSSSRTIDPNQIVLRLTFASKVSVTTNK